MLIDMMDGATSSANVLSIQVEMVSGPQAEWRQLFNYHVASCLYDEMLDEMQLSKCHVLSELTGSQVDRQGSRDDWSLVGWMDNGGIKAGNKE